MGIVAMLGDMTYEGARGLVGPWLALLGASATALGFVAGLGELLGYGLRLYTGRLADRTRAYWGFVVGGYAMNLVAVPGLALVGSWEAALVLVLLERIGKAIRSPARSTLVSHAASAVGAGWSFGLDEALDQIGAVVGPLLTALVIWGLRDEPAATGYRVAFAILLVPVLLNLALVLRARRLYPQPEAFEVAEVPHPERHRLFRLFVVAGALVAIGFADWALIAYHAAKVGALGPAALPLVYAAVMAVDALAALALGPLFDRHGLVVLAVAVVIGAAAGPLVFLGDDVAPLLCGAAAWGIGMGAQESIFKATIARLVPKAERARAYGVFFAFFGLAWWLGSTLLGALYDHARGALVVATVVPPLLAAPLVLHIARRLG